MSRKPHLHMLKHHHEENDRIAQSELACFPKYARYLTPEDELIRNAVRTSIGFSGGNRRNYNNLITE